MSYSGYGSYYSGGGYGGNNGYGSKYGSSSGGYGGYNSTYGSYSGGAGYNNYGGYSSKYGSSSSSDWKGYNTYGSKYGYSSRTDGGYSGPYDHEFESHSAGYYDDKGYRRSLAFGHDARKDHWEGPFAMQQKYGRNETGHFETKTGEPSSAYENRSIPYPGDSGYDYDASKWTWQHSADGRKWRARDQYGNVVYTQEQIDDRPSRKQEYEKEMRRYQNFQDMMTNASGLGEQEWLRKEFFGHDLPYDEQKYWSFIKGLREGRDNIGPWDEVKSMHKAVYGPPWEGRKGFRDP
jgi:hypothetical protein